MSVMQGAVANVVLTADIAPSFHIARQSCTIRCGLARRLANGRLVLLTERQGVARMLAVSLLPRSAAVACISRGQVRRAGEPIRIPTQQIKSCWAPTATASSDQTEHIRPFRRSHGGWPGRGKPAEDLNDFGYAAGSRAGKSFNSSAAHGKERPPSAESAQIWATGSNTGRPLDSVKNAPRLAKLAQGLSNLPGIAQHWSSAAQQSADGKRRLRNGRENAKLTAWRRPPDDDSIPSLVAVSPDQISCRPPFQIVDHWSDPPPQTLPQICC